LNASFLFSRPQSSPFAADSYFLSPIFPPRSFPCRGHCRLLVTSPLHSTQSTDTPEFSLKLFVWTSVVLFPPSSCILSNHLQNPEGFSPLSLILLLGLAFPPSCGGQEWPPVAVMIPSTPSSQTPSLVPYAFFLFMERVVTSSFAATGKKCPWPLSNL